MTVATTPGPVRYAPAQGETFAEMQAAVQRTDLYQLGDCRLVWVNEGDLYLPAVPSQPMEAEARAKAARVAAELRRHAPAVRAVLGDPPADAMIAGADEVDGTLEAYAGLVEMLAALRKSLARAEANLREAHALAARRAREGEQPQSGEGAALPAPEVNVLFRADDFRDQLGVVRLEQWPEGLVLWAGGQIRWRSWQDPLFWNAGPPAPRGETAALTPTGPEHHAPGPLPPPGVAVAPHSSGSPSALAFAATVPSRAAGDAAPAAHPASAAPNRLFLEHIATLANAPVEGIWRGDRGRGGATWAHWQVGLAYAKWLSPPFHAWCNTVVRWHMEGRLPPPPPPPPPGANGDLVAYVRTLAQSALQLTSRLQEAEERIAELEPKAEVLEQISASAGTMCLTDAAKVLGVKPRSFFIPWLIRHGLLYQRQGSAGYVVAQAAADAGWLRMVMQPAGRKPDGTQILKPGPAVTNHGLTRIGEMLEAERLPLRRRRETSKDQRENPAGQLRFPLH